MRVISASRRTDIPAFYSDWFISRIREGYVRWVNPFSRLIHQISIRPEDVLAFVFWSKNYTPLLPHLDELDRRGYRMLYHFTITGLPKEFEPNVPDQADLIDCARFLSARYGQDAVLWRYDPVLISSITERQYHLDRFAELCAALDGIVSRCYFSFVVFHSKVKRNLGALEAATGIECRDIPAEERISLANELADIASPHGIGMYSCCGDSLVGGKVNRAKCTDAELIGRLFPNGVRRLATAPTREQCGCCECTDIGAYDTCAHGCAYCYANSSPRAAVRNLLRQNNQADMLRGSPAASGHWPSSTKADNGSASQLRLDMPP